MKEIKKASFTFESYKIEQFSFKNPSSGIDTISYSIIPSGIFYSKNGVFDLNFEFIVNYVENDENELLRLKVLSVFNFGAALAYSDVPPYFFKNSIAIVFPYIRAFVTTLTSLASVKPIILDLLNLTALDGFFKENIRVVD